MCGFFGFFFFKQKTAYEMLRSLVGSEMCIRDSLYPEGKKPTGYGPDGIDAAALPVEDAGGILLALHNLSLIHI